MAPSSIMFVNRAAFLSPKEKNKLRKPVVEKMRRDRINSSIEQLKVLLEREFQRHQPNSKLEKADILEMTVDYLKQQGQLPVKAAAAAAHKDPIPVDFKEGYSRCLQEAFHFMSLHKVQSETQAKLASHFRRSQPPALEAPGRSTAPKLLASKNIPWRPW